jgi:two-component system cell cycle sensor histidine kinase/response regulator CckA
LHTPRKAAAPQPPPLSPTDVRAYGLALIASMLGLGITRVTWPVLAGTPLVMLFGAVVVTTMWGSARAGLVAIVLTILGAPIAFPLGPWQPRTLAVFICTAMAANRIVASRNRAAAALRASEAQLGATWEHGPLGTALLNRLGEIERINPALERLLGYSPAACAGLPFNAFTDLDDAAAEGDRFTDLLAGTDACYQHEQRYRRQDGTLLWGRVTMSVIRGSGELASGALAVLEDVTAQRQAELDLRASGEKLRQAQKMEAIGQLVAGVAHNFNNLLTVTMGYAELLLSRHRDEEPDQSDLQEIRRAAQRGAALTRQLLAFGRKHDAAPLRIELNRAVAGTRNMLTGVIRADIQLTIDVVSEPAAIVIDPHDLEQVILNLVVNARDALPGGGTIHIDVGREAIAAAGGAPDIAVTPGEYVRLRVRDNGTGMTAHVQSHLFEPFFTTKAVGQGTGLGLAFVHGIARHNGGFVSIQSAPGEGTAVSVYFPPASEALPDAAVEASPLPAGTRPPGATILLVEDEAPVSIMLGVMLKSAGYRVLSAATPREACVLFEQHAAEIDLLLTDIVMPEMNGPALAQRLVAQRPDLRVLFVSGYNDAMPASATGAPKVAYLAKPFPADQLLAAVAALLTDAQLVAAADVDPGRSTG